MNRASTSGTGQNAACGRPGAFYGPARAARKPKAGPNNLCDDKACKHFRSDHRPPRGNGACKVDGCACQGMVW